VPKVIAHMDEMPYIDKKGIAYKYGEFFPTSFLNSVIMKLRHLNHFPLSKEQAIAKGHTWKDREEKNVTIGGDIIGCSHNGECTIIARLALKSSRQKWISTKKWICQFLIFVQTAGTTNAYLNEIL